LGSRWNESNHRRQKDFGVVRNGEVTSCQSTPHFTWRTEILFLQHTVRESLKWGQIADTSWKEA